MAKVDEKSLYELLKNVFGFDQFKGNQKEIIKSISRWSEHICADAHGWRKVVMLSVACAYQ